MAVKIMEYLTEEDYVVAAQNGISRKRAYQRFYQYFWDRERTITQPIEKVSRWDRYKSVCESNGISQNTFDRRIRHGKSSEEAATTKLSTRGRKKVGNS
jgi:hypothetical protein